MMNLKAIFVLWCFVEDVLIHQRRNKSLTKLWNDKQKNEQQEVLIGSNLQQLPRRQAFLGIIGAGGKIIFLRTSICKYFSCQPFIFLDVVYTKIVVDALKRLQRGDMYPPQHEEKVSFTLDQAIKASALIGLQDKTSSSRPFRILEVGIGENCRSINRGLYDHAFSNLEKDIPSTFSGIEIVGLDMERPNMEVIHSVHEKLKNQPCPIDFQFVQGDISNTKLPFTEGYFDVIICLLVLCSVVDQSTVLSQIKHLLRSDGGTFGYVEHVAVNLGNPSEKGRVLLEWEQQFLDPIQQVVAQNCHLHRSTDDAIYREFDVISPLSLGKQQQEGNRILWNNRFFVDDMWPVSCQCCGVIQKRI